MKSRSLLICSVALAASFSSPVFAESKRALVIAEDANDHSVSIEISETLLGLGFDVERLEAPTDGDLEEAVARLKAANDPTVVFSSAASVDVRNFLTDDAMAPRLVFADYCADVADLDVPARSYLLVRSDDCEAPLSEGPGH